MILIENFKLQSFSENMRKVTHVERKLSSQAKHKRYIQ